MSELKVLFENNKKWAKETTKQDPAFFNKLIKQQSYTEPAKQLTHFIYNNKNDGEYLLPELKHLDFLWLLKGEAAADESLPEIIQQIKTINAVQLVVELTNEKIKNKENLVL